MLLGLDAPTAGEALVGGRRYETLAWPLREVGALLDAGAPHPGRAARDHLRALAVSNRIPSGRVDEALAQAGLAEVAGQRVGSFSLGMRQRLGVAAALLGDPAVLLLDEPVNGLDVDGIRWIRGLLRELAGEGRAILVSSHLLREVEVVADRLVVIGRGRLVAAGSVADLVDAHSGPVTVVRTPDVRGLRRALDAAGAAVTRDPTGGWRVTGLRAEEIGELAHEHRVPLHELAPRTSSLEEVYDALTRERVEHRALAEAAR
jgi:ABC-2 type transport system ATP-binding protein